jgi:hypothetical protein
MTVCLSDSSTTISIFPLISDEKSSFIFGQNSCSKKSSALLLASLLNLSCFALFLSNHGSFFS